MDYVWAAAVTLVVVLFAGGGIIAVHRWVAIKKVKIALDLSIALVLGVVGIASQTFTGVLQVFPSAGARSTSTSGQSPGPCSAQYIGALIQLWPKAVGGTSHVTISGDGFPANEVVQITFHDEQALSSQLQDVGSIRSDECGKFNYSWNIPSFLVASGDPTIEIIATVPNSRSAQSVNCCRATAMLTMNTAP